MSENPDITPLRQYCVIGPERIWIDVVCDDGTGPAMPEHDVYFIEAPNRKIAKWAAYRLAKNNGDRWHTDLGGEHPLSGVRVEDVTDVPDESTEDWPEQLRTVAYG